MAMLTNEKCRKLIRMRLCVFVDVLRQILLWNRMLSTSEKKHQVLTFLIFFSPGLVCNLPIMIQHVCVCWNLL